MNVMNADWQMVQDLFEELVDAPPAERERRMAAFSPSPEVMAEAMALFAIGEALDDTPAARAPSVTAFEAPATTASQVEPERKPEAATGSPQPVPSEPVSAEPVQSKHAHGSLPLGTMIGPFRLKNLLSRGSRGELYMARRADVGSDGRVVVRLLRPEYGPRFDMLRAERKLLTELQLPGIARLLQGGKMPDGRPYLVSDFAEGEDILSHVRRRKLGLAARLRLMLDICAIVASGHRLLVVHQDVKPAHILVADGGKVTLLDFGLAPMLGGDAANEERVVAGSTLAYAAPDYLKGARPTVATDVYALGAVLFELLTGVAPWLTGGKSSSPLAARMLNNEPPLASTVKAAEPTVPPIDAALLAGDLDAIIAKAMRYDPAARYDSVAALADDIVRAMKSRPVLARRGGVVYRVRRYLRRNRITLAASAAILVGGLVVFGAGLQYLGFGARATESELQLARVETARDLMALVLRSAAAGQVAGFSTIREVLDRTVEQVENEPAGSAVPAELLLAVGSTFLELEEFDGAAPMLERYRAGVQARGEGEALARADMLLGAAAVGSGTYDEAAKYLDAAEAFWGSSPRRFVEEQAMVDNHRATLLGKTGLRSDALELLREAIARLDRAARGNSLAAAVLQQNLGLQLMEAGQLDEAGLAFDKATALLNGLGRGSAPAAMTLDGHKALLAYARGNWAEASLRWEEAISRRRALYGPSDALAAVELSFGRALLARGEPLAARLRFNDALSMTTASSSQNGTVYAMLLQSRGLANLGAGDLRAAEQDLTRALDVAETLFGNKSLYYGMAVMAHAEMSFMRRDVDQARADIAVAEPIFAASGAAGREQQKALMAIKKIINSGSRVSG